jgi:hypothetical protein
MSRSQCKLQRPRAGWHKWPASLLVGTTMAFAASIGLAAGLNLPTYPTIPTAPNTSTGPSTPGGGGTGGTTQVTVSGTVTSTTNQAIAGAQVTFAGTSSYTATTNANGQYSLSAAGNSTYTATFKATGYNSLTQSNVFVGTVPITQNATLTPAAPVAVTATISGTPTPGATVTLVGSYEILDGSTLVGTPSWSQTAGVPVTINGDQATLADASAYKDALVAALHAPPMTADQLPQSLQSLSGNIEDFNGGIQDRWQVAAINAHQLEAAQDGTLVYTVTTTSGTYSGSVELDPEIPWAMSTGLQTVPVGVGVLLYGKTQSGYDWSIKRADNTKPPALSDASTQSPYFTPDKNGEYDITEKNSGTTIKVYAGKWHGAIDPYATQYYDTVNETFTPAADTSCTNCHSPAAAGGIAPDMFTPWLASGHPIIFQYNLVDVQHELASCDACHTLGFNLTAKNNGFDDQAGYGWFDQNVRPGYDGAWLDNAWMDILYDPEIQDGGHGMQSLARFASVQCESCHGPQDYTAQTPSDPTGSIHGFWWPSWPELNTARVSLSASVCGSCHGEPLHHARFQEWQISSHGDYSLAESRGSNANCTRCHSGNGFVLWTTEYQNDPSETLAGEITWNADTVEPQSCQSCHDPHSPGTDSGAPGDGDVRVSGNTPLLLAGFTAYAVGKGAVCMLCHNSRGGVMVNGKLVPRTDANWATTGDAESLPHHSTAADLIEGQNAYFVSGGTPGKHATIENTCVQCHMDLTEAPAALNLPGATNHTFNADPAVCSNCHGSYTSAGVQSQISTYLDALNTAIVAQYEKLWADPSVTGVNLGGTTYAKDSITQVALSTYHGESGLAFTIAGPPTTTVTEPLTEVELVGGTNDGTSVDQLISDTVLKATWNYWLVAQGGGMGVHNHYYSQKALSKALDAVNALP